MSKIVEYKQPCKKCGSSDARQVYEEGTSYCFSCGTYFPASGEIDMSFFRKTDPSTLLPKKFIDRKIGFKVNEFFGVKAETNESGEIIKHYYPYGDAFKVRELPKTFRWIGKKPPTLFGQEKFSPGKRIIITEGEIDTLSIAQAYYEKYERVYPVVSVPSATDLVPLINQRAWLRQFAEIIIAFDQDAPGQKAAAEAVKILGYDKCKNAKLPFKDANEVLLNKSGQTLLNHIYDSERVVPSGIIGKEKLWEALEAFNKIESVPYPACIRGLNDKLKGMRPGEIVLFTSGTGCLSRDVKVMLSNGYVKAASAVRIDDVLVGPDGSPRYVQRLYRGTSPMYGIYYDGDHVFNCNNDHVFTVYDKRHKKVVDVDFQRLNIKHQMGIKSGSDQKFRIHTKYLGQGNYYGWQLSGDGRFVLANGVITHNSGKSTLLREIILDRVLNSDDKVGIISLEEAPAETARKLSGMALKKNPVNEELNAEELKKGFDKVFGTDQVIVLDHQGSITDNSIMDQLEYMCLIGCKYLFIDHITILVSEGVENLQGNEAIDKMMNNLLRLAKRYPVWTGLISHLRKTGTGGKSFEEGNLPSLDDIRGSGSIKQISFDILAFARNMIAEDESERNLIKMRVLKSRFTGLTGDVKGAVYDFPTGRLVHVEDKALEEFGNNA